MGNRMTVENMVSALDNVTWYNGLAEYVAKWKTDCPKVGNTLISDETYCCGEMDCTIFDQLQVIWMICVELFGNCGTSPRRGWIEDIDGFNWFIDSITRLWREEEEERGRQQVQPGQSDLL